MTKKHDPTRPALDSPPAPAHALDKTGMPSAVEATSAGPKAHAAESCAAATAGQSGLKERDIPQIRLDWIRVVGTQLGRFPDDDQHRDRIVEALQGIPYHILEADMRRLLLKNRRKSPTASSEFDVLIKYLLGLREKCVSGSDEPATARDLRPRFICHPAGSGSSVIVFATDDAIRLQEQGYRVDARCWRQEDLPHELQDHEEEHWEEQGRRMARARAGAEAYELAGCNTWGERIGRWRAGE